jgi:hypothetical protein
VHEDTGRAFRPRIGDTVIAWNGESRVRSVVRRFACIAATDDERRYGCWLVVDSAGEEHVVTADVSGRYSRTFRPCSAA